MELESFPVAELTNIDIANVYTAAKAIAEKADIGNGAKVRMSKNVIAKNGIEPLKRLYCWMDSKPNASASLPSSSSLAAILALIWIASV
jgi:predicted amidohydrolase